MKTARTFALDVNSIPAARRFVLAAIGSAIAAEQRDAVAVMVSELAMNAVEHARTPFQVTVEITDGSLRVEVTDSGGGTPAAQPPPRPASLRGRGLFIVDRLSDAWGTSSSAGSATSVWFTIALDAAADPAAMADSAAHQSASPEAAPQAARPPVGTPDRRTSQPNGLPPCPREPRLHVPPRHGIAAKK